MAPITETNTDQPIQEVTNSVVPAKYRAGASVAQRELVDLENGLRKHLRSMINRSLPKNKQPEIDWKLYEQVFVTHPKESKAVVDKVISEFERPGNGGGNKAVTDRKAAANFRVAILRLIDGAVETHELEKKKEATNRKLLLVHEIEDDILRQFDQYMSGDKQPFDPDLAAYREKLGVSNENVAMSVLFNVLTEIKNEGDPKRSQKAIAIKQVLEGSLRDNVEALGKKLHTAHDYQRFLQSWANNVAKGVALTKNDRARFIAEIEDFDFFIMSEAAAAKAAVQNVREDIRGKDIPQAAKDTVLEWLGAYEEDYAKTIYIKHLFPEDTVTPVEETTVTLEDMKPRMREAIRLMEEAKDYKPFVLSKAWNNVLIYHSRELLAAVVEVLDEDVDRVKIPKLRARIVSSFTQNVQNADLRAAKMETLKVKLKADMDWLSGKDLVLQKNDVSRLHQYLETWLPNSGEDSGVAKSETWDEEEKERFIDLLHESQVFVVKHNWAAAFEGSLDEVGEDYKLPYPNCVFEFMVSGRPLTLLATQEGDAPVKFVSMHVLTNTDKLRISDEADWSKFPESVHADGETPFTMVKRQVQALCIALDAEIATKETTFAPSKLNQKRAVNGKPLLRDFHVVDLSRRVKARAEGRTTGDGTGTKKRLHFRRAHDRHYANGLVKRIAWMLVGDPSLGFVDKQYRL